MKEITIQLDDDRYKRLEVLAAKFDVTVKDVAERAIASYIEMKRKRLCGET